MHFFGAREGRMKNYLGVSLEVRALPETQI
jgi:hypothetical protein